MTETGAPLLSRENARTDSRRDSSAPVANTRPGAVAAQTLVTTVNSSNCESARGGPLVRLMPLRTRSPAPRPRPIARIAPRLFPTKPSTVRVAPGSGLAVVSRRPQRPGAGSRTTILLADATQPKISALLPVGPHAAPVGETARKPSPADPVISRRAVGGIGVGLAGAGAPSAIVTCVPAGTVTL